jgi:hypothetical protein
MQSAVAGLSRLVPTAHAVILVNEDGIPVTGKISADRAGCQEAKSRAIIVPAPPSYGDRLRGAF